MPLRSYKPTSAGRRFMTRSTFEEVTTREPYKPLLEPMKRGSGRNNQGRLTVRHRGGGEKRHYRIIDFKRDKFGVPAKVATVEYDPNRSARIGLLHYRDGEKRYMLLPARPQGRRRRRRRPRRRGAGGERPAARQHPARHDDPQHRARARQGRPDRPLRRGQRPAPRQGGRLRHRPAPVRRDAARAAPLHRDRRPGRRTWTTRTRASARPGGPATWASARRPAASR